jgi:hypothetical protein
MGNETSLELKVEKFSLGELTSNARGILEAVKVKLEGYKAENYSGDRIQDAKRDKAELNAAAKALNDKRIEYEKKWMAPFEEFKAVVRDTCAAITTASMAIDRVVKEVELAEKAEKRKLIEEFFASQNLTLFTLDRIFEDRWLNKTEKMDDIFHAITQRIAKTKDDLAILDRGGEAEARKHYLTHLDLVSALAAADNVKANEARLKALEGLSVKVHPSSVLAKTIAIEYEEIPVSKEPMILEYVLRIRGTLVLLQALKVYMTDHGITYEKEGE